LLPFQRLDVYQAARELAHRVHTANISDSELRDQATRAAKSTFLQLCEGLPNEASTMRRRYFVGANNSLHEVVGAIDLAEAIEAICKEDPAAIQELASRTNRMLRGLLRPRSRRALAASRAASPRRGRASTARAGRAGDHAIRACVDERGGGHRRCTRRPRPHDGDAEHEAHVCPDPHRSRA